MHIMLLERSGAESPAVSHQNQTPWQQIRGRPRARLSFCSVRSHGRPPYGRCAISGFIRRLNRIMYIPICGCSLKERSPAGLLPPPATIRCCRSCPGTPESLVAGWPRCSVHWRNGHRRSTGRSRSEKGSCTLGFKKSYCFKAAEKESHLMSIYFTVMLWFWFHVFLPGVRRLLLAAAVPISPLIGTVGLVWDSIAL